MERRFFGVLAHLVFTFILVSANRLRKSHKPSRVTRQDFGDGLIHLELKAPNNDNTDLDILLQTILDVKNFVKLIHVIAVNHIDEIDLSDLRDKSKDKRNYHGTHTSLEDEGDESDNANASNLRRQLKTLKPLTRHFRDIVRKVLTEILSNLKNHTKNKRRYKGPSDRKHIALVEEIAEIMKQTISILIMKSGRKMENFDETPSDPWVQEFSRQMTHFDTEHEALLSLYEETKILRKLIFENCDLCDCHRNQKEESEEVEESNDLNEAFEFFMSFSKRLKLTYELQNCLMMLLHRIMKIRNKNLDEQGLNFDYQNQGIESNKKSSDSSEKKNVYHYKDADTTIIQLTTKEHYSGAKILECADEISTNDRNGEQQNKQIISRNSDITASQKCKHGNLNVRELQITTNSDSEENLNEVLPKDNTIKELEEERTTTEVIISDTLDYKISDITKNEQNGHPVHVPIVEQKQTIVIPKTENHKNSKFTMGSKNKTDGDNDSTDLIFDAVVTEAFGEMNEMYNSSGGFIDTIVIEGNERNEELDKKIDLSIDAIGSKDREGQIGNNNTRKSSVDKIITERTEEKTDSLMNEIVTQRNYEISENNTTDFILFVSFAPENNSTEAYNSTIFVIQKNKPSRIDEENAESNARKNGTASGHYSDIQTTMRFGFDDLYKTKIHKKNNASAIDVKTAMSPNENSKPIVTGWLPPSSSKIIEHETNDIQNIDYRKNNFIITEETRKSLGLPPNISRQSNILNQVIDQNLAHKRDQERLKKNKYIMDILLESINSIIADNGTNWVKPTDHGKSLR